MEYKTIREWFELLPDNGLRKMAMDKTNDHKLRMRVGDMGTAVKLAFNWEDAGPDYKFWEGVYERAESGFYEAKYATPSETLSNVIHDLRTREAVGLKKYGTTVNRPDLSLRDWLQHTYEEVLDQAMYLKRAISLIDEQDRPSV